MIAFSGFGGMFNLRFDDFKKIEDTKINPEIKQQLIDFFSHNADWIIIGTSFAAIIFWAFLILQIIAKGGLIKSIGKISKNEPTNFKEGFHEGRKYFWRLLFIKLAIGIFMITLTAILSIPIIFLFINKSYLLGGLLLFGAIIILLPILIVASFTGIFGCIYAVLGDLSFWPAIEAAYLLFRRNLGSSFIISLIILLVGMVFGIIIMLSLLPLIIIFFLTGLISYLILKNIGLAIIVTLGVLTIFAVILFLQSIFQTFIQAIWVLFFKEIASPKIPETIPEAIPEKIPSPSAAPDPVTFSEE